MKLSILLYALLILATGCARSGLQATRYAENPEQFEIGTFERIDALLRGEALDGSIPAGSVAIWREGSIVYTNEFGHLVPDDESSPRVDDSTLFDLASLTKPLAGVPVGTLLYERGEQADRLALLLSHGTECRDAETVPALLKDTTRDAMIGRLRPYLQAPRGERPLYRYSNAMYALPGLELKEGVADAERLLAERFWNRSGVESFTWHPDRRRSAASGRNAGGDWIVGDPYDPLAHYLRDRIDAAPTHSGLFGTASDVARFGGVLSTAPGALKPLVEGSRPRRDPLTDRTLWITVGGMISPMGPPMAPPRATVGRFLMHTGYTGCLLWIDRDRSCSVAILTNASAADAEAEFNTLSESVISTILQGSLP